MDPMEKLRLLMKLLTSGYGNKALTTDATLNSGANEAARQRALSMREPISQQYLMNQMQNRESSQKAKQLRGGPTSDYLANQYQNQNASRSWNIDQLIKMMGGA
jgi:hypothetical protein